MGTLCLNMIVKNEEHIILQTLENICKHLKLDYWVIADTGPSDKTMDLVKQFFQDKNIPGELHQHPWVNFSENRNLALAACQDKSDYVLFFDADDYFDGEIQLPELNLDAYHVQMCSESRNNRYLRKLIIKNNQKFRWRGVLHEFLDSAPDTRIGQIEGNYVVVSGRKGQRSQDPEKYLKDAQCLAQAFDDAVDQDLLPRYAFYCAQSYRDYGNVDLAIHWYRKRVDMQHGWQDERYYSYEQLGLLFEKKKDYKEAFYYWQCGIILDPQRAECWYHSARRHSWNQHAHLAYTYALQGSQLSLPKGNRLFVNAAIYQYWLHYELCLNAYKLGEHQISYNAFKALVEYCPEDLIDRLAHQMKKYRPLILQDHFITVQQLAGHLNRFQKRSILEDLF